MHRTRHEPAESVVFNGSFALQEDRRAGSVYKRNSTCACGEYVLFSAALRCSARARTGSAAREVEAMSREMGGQTHRNPSAKRRSGRGFDRFAPCPRFWYTAT